MFKFYVKVLKQREIFQPNIQWCPVKNCKLNRSQANRWNSGQKSLVYSWLMFWMWHNSHSDCFYWFNILISLTSFLHNDNPSEIFLTVDPAPQNSKTEIRCSKKLASLRWIWIILFSTVYGNINRKCVSRKLFSDSLQAQH